MGQRLDAEEISRLRVERKMREDCSVAIMKYTTANVNTNKFTSEEKNEQIKGLIKDFGAETMDLVLAFSVSPSDGRYSNANQEWAKNIVRKVNVNQDLLATVNEHPALLDMMIHRYLKVKEEMLQEKAENEFSLKQMNEMKKELQNDQKETKNKTQER